MELALILALAKPKSNDEGGERRDKTLSIATLIDAGMCDLLHPLGVPRVYPLRARSNAVPQIGAVLANAGIEAALIDQSRPDFGLSVMRAVAPDLQSLPSPIVTRRLQNALTMTGGGERFTHGVLLF